MSTLTINGATTNYNNLFIYDGDKILFETCRPYELNLEIKNLTIRNARKLSFDKCDCFEIKSNKESYSLSNNGKDLYIHSSIISVEKVEEKQRLQAHGETNYKNVYTLKLNCDSYRWNKHIEKITGLPKDTPLTDYDSNGKWGGGFSKTCNMYDTSENHKTGEINLFKRWLTYDKTTEIIVESDYYTRTEKTEERIEREKIADIITSCIYSGKTISHYEVEKILEKLNISIK